CCFFFQAEDGIRDFHVTGVQTCALPILSLARLCFSFSAFDASSRLFRRAGANASIEACDQIAREYSLLRSDGADRTNLGTNTLRSEERRVGKEGRSRRSPRQ